MFFYDLPRFSVDLDFNLLEKDMENPVYHKVRNILLKYGSIYDEAKKYYGPLIVLNYGHGERNLKVEISNREFENRYEIRNLLGINVKEDYVEIDPCEKVTAKRLGKRIRDEKLDIKVSNGEVEILNNPDLDIRISD